MRPFGACLEGCSACKIERRPRGASRVNPLLHLFRANYSCGTRTRAPLAHASISRRTNKAVARAWHRRDWPETNVGAGLPAKRRAGGARSHGRPKTIARHLEAILQCPDDHLAAMTRTHKSHHKSPNYQLGPTSPRTISYVHANPKELSYTPCRRPSDCPGKACSLG